MSPYRTSTAWQEEALVCFEHGWIRLGLPAPLALNRPGTVTVYKNGEEKEPLRYSPDLPSIHAMKRQAENFVGAVRGERPPVTTAEEALSDLRVAEEYLDLLDRARTSSGPGGVTGRRRNGPSADGA
jgi:predicted dehydrogenase